MKLPQHAGLYAPRAFAPAARFLFQHREKTMARLCRMRRVERGRLLHSRPLERDVELPLQLTRVLASRVEFDRRKVDADEQLHVAAREYLRPGCPAQQAHRMTRNIHTLFRS